MSNNSYSCPPSPIPPWHRPTNSPVTQTLTGAGEINLTTDTTYLSQSDPADEEDESVAYAVVLPDGQFKRQGKQIYIPSADLENTAQFRVTGTLNGGISLLFNRVGFNAILIWDGAGWQMVGGNATLEDS